KWNRQASKHTTLKPVSCLNAGQSLAGGIFSPAAVGVYPNSAKAPAHEREFAQRPPGFRPAVSRINCQHAERNDQQPMSETRPGRSCKSSPNTIALPQ